MYDTGHCSCHLAQRAGKSRFFSVLPELIYFPTWHPAVPDIPIIAIRSLAVWSKLLTLITRLKHLHSKNLVPDGSRRMPGVISFTPRARRPPLALIAHAILAILLASVMAATFAGRRASNAVSQGRCSVPWILA